MNESCFDQETYHKQTKTLNKEQTLNKKYKMLNIHV